MLRAQGFIMTPAGTAHQYDVTKAQYGQTASYNMRWYGINGYTAPGGSFLYLSDQVISPR
jgi:hypothetical protein